jgi:hypothetical protein
MQRINTTWLLNSDSDGWLVDSVRKLASQLPSPRVFGKEVAIMCVQARRWQRARWVTAWGPKKEGPQNLTVHSLLTYPSRFIRCPVHYGN